MLISSIKLNNFLSFGPDAKAIELGPLNVLIGPNGSGKSNFLEAIGLLKSAPTDIQKTIREGGGIREWLWKGAEPLTAAQINLIIHCNDNVDLIYALRFYEEAQQFKIFSEAIGVEGVHDHVIYSFAGGYPSIKTEKELREFKVLSVDLNKSILSQIKEPERFQEITYLGDAFSSIKLYREWGFGSYTAPRLPQRADMPNDMLESDCSNLGLVLNRLRRDPDTKGHLLTSLQRLYQGISDFDVQIEGGTVQVFLQEGRTIIPATRLSDGTLRYLCLLAILCHPKPPPLVCIEEPELGLHPDILPGLADLLKEASTRCQIIVTTHSEVLVDAMTDMPEAVLVAEKHEGGTEIKRLDPDEMKPWLEKYRLGQLWTRGDIGGNRW
jgi:predicted ATPase